MQCARQGTNCALLRAGHGRTTVVPCDPQLHSCNDGSLAPHKVTSAVNEEMSPGRVVTAGTQKLPAPPARTKLCSPFCGPFWRARALLFGGPAGKGAASFNSACETEAAPRLAALCRRLSAKGLSACHIGAHPPMGTCLDRCEVVRPPRVDLYQVTVALLVFGRGARSARS